MPSIFVWKTDRSLPTTTIRYYSGSNWFMEEHGAQSYSYLLCNQHSFQDGTVVDVKPMPRDWMGSYLLEVTTIPYQRIHEDTQGVLEQLGEWMRYRTKMDIPFEPVILEREWERIRRPKQTDCLIRIPCSVTPLVIPNETRKVLPKALPKVLPKEVLKTNPGPRRRPI